MVSAFTMYIKIIKICLPKLAFSLLEETHTPVHTPSNEQRKWLFYRINKKLKNHMYTFCLKRTRNLTFKKRLWKTSHFFPSLRGCHYIKWILSAIFHLMCLFSLVIILSALRFLTMDKLVKESLCLNFAF